MLISFNRYCLHWFRSRDLSLSFDSLFLCPELRTLNIHVINRDKAVIKFNKEVRPAMIIAFLKAKVTVAERNGLATADGPGNFFLL